MLTHLSLFSGIGGLDIAAEMAGFQTVAQCERDDFPTEVLENHWPDVPRWRDIRTLTGDDFYARTGRRTVDVISGGFPCQPFSLAGKRKGTADDRYLWPEMLRVVSELRPTWVIGENVAGLVSMVKSVSPFRVEGRSLNRFEDSDHYEAILSRQEDMLLVSLIGDLERLEYSVQAFVIPACAVGARHRRDRIALIAHTDSAAGRLWGHEPEGRQWQCRTTDGDSDVAHTDRDGQCADTFWKTAEGCDGHEIDIVVPKSCDVGDTLCKHGERNWPSGIKAGEPEPSDSNRRPAQPRLGGVADGIPGWMDGYWLTEPDVPRVAAGVPRRVDKLKAYGNAVYWPQFFPFYKAIHSIETGETP